VPRDSFLRETKTVCVILEKEQAQALAGVARQYRCSVSTLVRETVGMFLSQMNSAEPVRRIGDYQTGSAAQHPGEREADA